MHTFECTSAEVFTNTFIVCGQTHIHWGSVQRPYLIETWSHDQPSQHDPKWDVLPKISAYVEGPHHELWADP